MIEVGDDFRGVVSISTGTEVTDEAAFGLADRAHGIATTVGTQFAIASATKVSPRSRSPR